MTLDEFRDEMNAYWRSVNEEAKSFKDPYVALERLRALYGKFSADERRMADQVIAEWILESDEVRRWDALALVTELKIVHAVPALRALARHLEDSTAPSASLLLARVKRKADDLEKHAAAPPG